MLVDVRIIILLVGVRLTLLVDVRRTILHGIMLG